MAFPSRLFMTFTPMNNGYTLGDSKSSIWSSTLLLTMCLFSDNLYLSTVIDGIRKSLILAVERRLLITRDKLWFRLTLA